MYHYLASSNIVLEDNILNKIFEILDKNNINKKNSYEITPILMSSRLNNTQICNFLIKKNCDLNLTNSNGNTPLMYACMNSNVDIVKKWR